MGPMAKVEQWRRKRFQKSATTTFFILFIHVDLIFSFLFAPLRKKKNAGRLAVVFRWRVFWLFYLTLSALLFLQLLCTTFSNSHNTFFYLLIHVLILVEHLPNSFMYSSKFSDLSSLYFLPTKDAIFIKCLFFLTLWRRNMKPAQRTLLNS